ncbi:hypothetical protein [Nocardioides flavescens]|uniref:Uncharacterized protein n=1 Tax=Nocardioides flavescens TaxID=2691959 RepID=A0A6L7F0J8_9ACTN|nr:hypothetical protein [Nocardioides flavescens]MXG90369.1 hypothetical protein [Nocardioides flavescens]
MSHPVLIAVDTGAGDLAGVDHVVHRLLEVVGRLPDTVASTHVVAGHHAVALSWTAETSPDPAALGGTLVSAYVGSGVVADVDGHRREAGPSDLLDGALEAAARHADRASGRLVEFPGRPGIERRLSVAEVVASSCVEDVVGLAGTVVTPESVVDLTGFARPTWADGRCTLLVQTGASGLIPFEVAQQLACCSHH